MTVGRTSQSNRARLPRLPCILCVLSLLTVGNPARAALEAVDVPSVKGSPRMVLAHRETADATLVIRFGVGSVDDGQTPGLTRLAQQALVLSTQDAEELQRELYASASDLTVGTSVREATFTLHARKEDFGGLAARVLRSVLKPRLLPKRFDLAKAAVAADQEGGDPHDQLVSFVAGSVLLLERAEGGGDFNSALYGDEEMLQQLTFKDVSQHLGRHFLPAGATITATGAFDETALRAVVKDIRGGKAARPLRRPDLSGRLPLTYDKPSRMEQHVRVQLVSTATPQDVAAVHLLTRMLTEHVMWALRRKGLAYGVDGTALIHEWMDAVTLWIPVTGAQDVDVPALLDGLTADVRDGTLPEERYTHFRTVTLEHLRAADQDSAALATLLATGQTHTRWATPEVVAALESMTYAQFQERVKPWLQDKSSIRYVFGRRTQMQGSTR